MRKDAIKWSKNVAYATGLMATDGHLSKDGRHIDLTSRDTEQLENFKKAFDLSCKVSYKISGYKQDLCPRIQFSDSKLYRWFIMIGLEQQKTENLGKLKIPDKYFFDFLRGHFDGDGSIYSYFDPRWKRSFMFYITFLAKNKKHVIWLQEKIYYLSGAQGKINLGRGVYQLRYAKAASKLIIHSMYGRGGLYLKRKYDKIQKILKMDADVL